MHAAPPWCLEHDEVGTAAADATNDAALEAGIRCIEWNSLLHWLLSSPSQTMLWTTAVPHLAVVCPSQMVRQRLLLARPHNSYKPKQIKTIFLVFPAPCTFFWAGSMSRRMRYFGSRVPSAVKWLSSLCCHKWLSSVTKLPVHQTSSAELLEDIA